MTDSNQLQLEGRSIYYETCGSGTPLILGHSFLCSGAMWAPQIAPLAEHYRVINVDLRGHGNSSVVDQPFDLYDLVNDVLAVLDHLEIESAIWAGLSIGGMVAMRAALVAGKRVSGLILLDSHAGAEITINKIKYRTMAATAKLTGTRLLAPKITHMFFCPHTRKSHPELIREWRERIASVPLAAVLRTVDALIDRDSVLDKLDTVQVPALVIVGKEDQPLPPAYSEEIAARLPNSIFALIDQAGHLPTLEQPQAVTAAMLSFLADQRLV